MTYESCHIWMSHGSICHKWAISRSCMPYGVATISRLLKMIGLFCKRALWKRLYSAKETYHFKEPTNRSHPIHTWASHVTRDGVMLHHRIWSLLQGSFAKETYIFKEPTNGSHPIHTWASHVCMGWLCMYIYIYIYIYIHKRVMYVWGGYDTWGNSCMYGVAMGWLRYDRLRWCATWHEASHVAYLLRRTWMSHAAYLLRRTWMSHVTYDTQRVVWSDT